MKHLRFFLFLTLLLAPTLGAAAELQRLSAPARITAVTVYPDRALTSRTATLDLKTGSYLLTFDGLPTLVEDDSIRVAGKGSAAATIVALEVKRVFLEGSGDKRVQELDREIRTLEQRSVLLDAKKAGISSQKQFIESIRVAWGERISQELAIGRPTAAELQDAVTFVGTGVSKTAEQTVEIEIEKEGIREKIDALRRQRNEASASGRKESKRVEVLVEVARAGSLTLGLDAVIARAGWVPAYDVRLAADAKSAELTFRALVRQQTGEDWSNVDLTLSTARPASGGAPPELSPWHISLRRPQPPMAKAMLYRSAAPAAARGEMAEMDVENIIAADALEEAPALVETAELSDEQSSVAFHLPRPIDIPADGSQHGSVVAVTTWPVSMEFLALPKLSPYVFLKAGIVNSGAYPLLPGKVNTFAGNTYTGSSQLRKVAAGEKFELFFGSDDQVTVRREELKQHKEAVLFGSNRVTYRYRLELNNFRQEAVTVTLRDQLPLAGDEEIKIALLDPSLPPESGSDGLLTWTAPLKGGEKLELTFGIQVDYPRDREISGL